MADMTDTQKTDAQTVSAPTIADPAPVARLAMVTLDAPDAAALGEFYSAVLGWPVAYSDENYAMLTGPSHALGIGAIPDYRPPNWPDRKSTRLNSSHVASSYAVFCLKKNMTRHGTP